MLDDKLYKQFYPLVTEEDKISFLDTNYAKILRIVKSISHVKKQ